MPVLAAGECHSERQSEARPTCAVCVPEVAWQDGPHQLGGACDLWGSQESSGLTASTVCPRKGSTGQGGAQ